MHEFINLRATPIRHFKLSSKLYEAEALEYTLLTCKTQRLISYVKHTTMYIPKPYSHYDIARGTDSSPRSRHEPINNPITYEIVLILAVVCLAILMPLIVDRYLRPCIAPDDHHADEVEEDNDEQEALPRDLTLTTDGKLLDNKTGAPPRQYGTFYVDRWYNTDGYVSPSHKSFSSFPERDRH